AAIGADMDELIAINSRGVASSSTAIAGLQRSTASLVAVLGLLGIVSTLLVGAWTTRLVLRNEAELARAALLLEQQNHELDAFAGRVAHDLRAPLTSLSLSASLLSKHTPPGDQPAME